MKPFDERAVCEKCGSADVSIRYRHGCGWRNCKAHPERIERHCRRCGHNWDEAPENKEKP